VPKDLLRVGLPMEDILRAQAAVGIFGDVDVEAEVARRMAILRAGTYPRAIDGPPRTAASLSYGATGCRTAGL
jgi:PAS domain-containing protein